jgi:hypothetical protein
MSPAPLTPEQYRTIGQALAQVAPPSWAAMDLTVVCVGPETRSRLAARMPDGRSVKAGGPVPRDVTRLLRDLRREAYRPGLGTWFTAHVVVEAAGRIALDFDYDNPPALEPAPNSWAEELRRYPREPQHVPSWLAQLAPGEREWLGARWQVEMRPPGVAAPPASSIDATTTPEAHVWAATLVERLAASGVGVAMRQDEGEDGRGNPTTYDELAITVGQGYMALAFWRGLIAWTVDVFPDQADRGTFTDVATRVLEAVQEITGYSADLGSLGSYERSLLSAA